MRVLWFAVSAGLTMQAGPARAQTAYLYDAQSSDVMVCPSMGPITMRVARQQKGRFGCGLNESMISPPLSRGYATIADVRRVAGEPRIQVLCPVNPRASDAYKAAGAVVYLPYAFDTVRRTDVVNTLVRDAMKRVNIKCPFRPLGTPAMGFVRLVRIEGEATAQPVAEVRTYGIGIWNETRLEAWQGLPTQPTAASAAEAPVRPVSAGWVTVRTHEPRPNMMAGIRGRLEILARGRGTVPLIAYSNGKYDGGTDLRLAPHQCTQLIVRYGQGLGLAEVKSTRDIGDGKDVARNFAARSAGRFKYHNGVGSASPPIPGAVISIAAQSVDGAAWSGNPYGHVGIAQTIERVSDDEFRVVLFDQNYPLPTGEWKRLTFKRENGVWTGAMSNTVRGIRQVLRVEGWANPV